MTGQRFFGLLALMLTVFATSTASAAGAPGAGAPHLDGAELGLIWVAPFAGILLSIALFPLLAPEFWHHHFGKVRPAGAIHETFAGLGLSCGSDEQRQDCS